MERREFLQSLGLALALAMAPSVGGCATLGGPDLAAFGAGEGPGLVAALDERLGRIRETGNLPRLRAWVAARGADPELPGKLFGTLWVTATFRDLPDETRRRPEIQRWMKDQVPDAAETAFAVADLLEALPPADRDELARVLREDPSVVEQVFEGFDGHGRVRGVEEERLRQVRDLSGHAAWRMRTQSVAAVLDDYVERVDRVCRRHGLDRAEWRASLAREREVWDRFQVASDPDSDVLRSVADAIDPDLVDAPDGRGAHLGLTLAAAAGGPAEVAHVVRGSPAARAGLRSGDRIAAVDGRPVGAPELIGWLRAQEPGRDATLTVHRGTETHALTARLDAGPGDRVVEPRGAAGGPTPYLSTGAKILGVGVNMLKVGGVVFGAGAVIGLFGIAVQSGGIAVAGAVLTILGGAIVVLGLFVVILGAIAKETERPHAAPPPEDEATTQ